MEQPVQDKRRNERILTALPVDLGTATATTRDVSASGVFFEIDASFALGSEIEFTVELDTPGGKMMLKCEGEIVRIEPRGTRVGVAVKLTESAIEPVRTEARGWNSY
ncbi:MAG TPA: PilZ domain-containing protein, partial [Candidatus Paceibacterota bacterium]|nr:PilZ domain-containing protein [Candidatus Paceibacterota bacterium]